MNRILDKKKEIKVTYYSNTIRIQLRGKHYKIRNRVWIPILQCKNGKIKKPSRITKIYPCVLFYDSYDINHIFSVLFTQCGNIKKLENNSIIYCDLNYKNQFKRIFTKMLLDIIKTSDIYIGISCKKNISDEINAIIGEINNLYNYNV